MKHIIIKGKTELRKRIIQCGHCNCQFTFTDDEIYKSEITSIHKSGKCVKCPWCLEEIMLPAFDGNINSIPQTRDSDAAASEKISAGSYEAMVDEIGW